MRSLIRDDLAFRRGKIRTSAGPEQARLQFHLLPRRGPREVLYDIICIFFNVHRCIHHIYIYTHIGRGPCHALGHPGPVEALLPQALSTVFKAGGLGQGGPEVLKRSPQNSTGNDLGGSLHPDIFWRIFRAGQAHSRKGCTPAGYRLPGL